MTKKKNGLIKETTKVSVCDRPKVTEGLLLNDLDFYKRFNGGEIEIYKVIESNSSTTKEILYGDFKNGFYVTLRETGELEQEFSIPVEIEYIYQLEALILVLTGLGKDSYKW